MEGDSFHSELNSKSNIAIILFFKFFLSRIEIFGSMIKKSVSIYISGAKEFFSQVYHFDYLSVM
jgi:hypothetical protein